MPCSIHQHPADCKATRIATLAREALQPQFVDVSDARGSLLATLGPKLDSLYLYGSVARASARMGTSVSPKAANEFNQKLLVLGAARVRAWANVKTACSHWS